MLLDGVSLGTVAIEITNAGINATSVLDLLENQADAMKNIAFLLLGVAVTGLVARVGFRTVRKFIGA